MIEMMYTGIGCAAVLCVVGIVAVLFYEAHRDD